MIAHGNVKQPHFAQGIQVVRLSGQNLVERHFSQLGIAPFTVNTPHPDKGFIAFGVQLDRAQVLEQRLIQVTRLVGTGSHQHGLVG
ncbi:hypothetical protein D9M69_563590 [compost metagenome]